MWPTIPLVPCPSSTPPRETSSGPCNVGRNPTALAITNKGTGNISDDIVFVTQIFAEDSTPTSKDPSKFDGNGESHDVSREARGYVQAFPAGNAESADQQNHPKARSLATSGF